MDSKRVGNISAEQKTIIIEFLESNPKLIKGKFNAEFTHKNAQQLWSNITAVLNSIPGAKKDWKQWRKTWQDMKNKTKGLQAGVLRDIRATGGGRQSAVSLDSTSNRIANMLDATAVTGDQTTFESIVEFSDDIDDNEGGDIILVENGTEHASLHKEYEEIEYMEEQHQRSQVNKKRKMVAPSKRLERSQQQCNDMLILSQSDCDIREKYYAKKLSLLVRKVEAQERIASAKERQVVAQERIAAATEIQSEAQMKIAVAASSIASLLESKLQ